MTQSMSEARKTQYDLTVIGAGLAGMAAAAFAANRGLSAAIVGSLGETWFTSGLIDLMGVHPVDTGKTWRDPWSAVDAVRADLPQHPYARLSNEEIKTALKEFYDLLNDAELPYRCQEDQNSELITAFGSIKTTHGVPLTMWPGVTALSRKSPCLIVDIQGLKGFSARLIAERLKPVWPGLHPLSLPPIYDDQAHEINPLPFANNMEIAEHRERFADFIRPHVKEVEFVGLPAVLGIHRAHRIVREFEERLGRPVFEIPAMPPSIPGIRLKETFMRILSEKGVRCLFQKQVLTVRHAADDEFALDIGKTDLEAQIHSKAIMLATGRFSGGGLLADQAGIKETLFDLPVSQPGQRQDWHAEDFFASAGHPINQAGIETDALARPLAANRRPAFEKLFAAGTILAHHDWIRMKCGSGLSVATAYHAVQSYLKSRS
jgi:glycerol-3-phosphate dehydrogenase subunit B